MKLPEKPNFDWKKELAKSEKDKLMLLAFYTGVSIELSALLKKANTRYDYWDSVKYYNYPQNTTPEMFWSLLKSVRETMDNKKILIIKPSYEDLLNFTSKEREAFLFKHLLTPEIMRKCSIIDRRSANYEFKGNEESEYSVNSKMEEGIASSQLEGAATTREMAKEMLRLKALPKDKSERMILNNYTAMDFVEKNCNEALCIEMIKDIHGIIVSEIEEKEDCGSLRTDADDIIVVDVRDNETIFVPPKAEKIENMLNALCDYANNDDFNDYTHPVIKAIIIHFWLAYIHPFKDGNGRTARALFYWFIFKNKYKNFKYLVISKILKTKPAQYKNAYLYTEYDENDLTYFINFNLNIIIEAMDGFEKYIAGKKEESKKASFLIERDIELNFRQRSIMKEFIKENKPRDLKYFENMLNVVYETARTDLDFLVKKRLLSKKKCGKKYLYSLSKNSNTMISENQNKYTT